MMSGGNFNRLSLAGQPEKAGAVGRDRYPVCYYASRTGPPGDNPSVGRVMVAAEIVKAIGETGYDRLVGLEYRSLAPSAESFRAVKALIE